MAKATNVAGGLIDELNRSADKAPGPGHYFKEKNEKNFVTGARGGIFSKMTREGPKSSDKGPSVGQYDTLNAQVTPRTKGGLMSRNDRVCAFARMAERQNQWNANGPGKYDTVVPENNVKAPNFNSSKTESRNPKKSTSVGPGYYNPNFIHTDFRPPSYSGSKEDKNTYMNRVNKDKNAGPFPAYKDMPDSKAYDKQGARKHCKRLLQDRQITPRRPQNQMSNYRRPSTVPAGTSRPASTPRQGTPRQGAGTPRQGMGTPRPGAGTPRQATPGFFTPRRPDSVQNSLPAAEPDLFRQTM